MEGPGARTPSYFRRACPPDRASALTARQSSWQRPERHRTDPTESRARRRSATRPCSPGDGRAVPRLQRSPGASGGTGGLSARVSLACSWRRICKPPRAARMDRRDVVTARRAARRKRLSSGCREGCSLACRGEHGAQQSPSKAKLWAFAWRSCRARSDRNTCQNRFSTRDKLCRVRLSTSFQNHIACWGPRDSPEPRHAAECAGKLKFGPNMLC